MTRRKWLAAGAVLVFVGVIAFRLSHHKAKPPNPDDQPVPVSIATAQTQNVPIYLEALGTVQAYRTVTVQPMITGPLIAIQFHEGQHVDAGAPLAEIDPRPYQAALDQAEAKKAQDLANLANARSDLARYNLLVKQNYTSAQQAAAAHATVQEDQAIVAQDEAAIETAQTNLSYTKITAPISGRTGILQVNAGNIVTPSLASGIVVITTLHPISVLFSLPQQDLPQIQAAMQAGPVAVIAAAEGDPATAPVLDRGVLQVLDNQVNANTGTLTLKAKFPNPQSHLWPGAFVNIRLLARTDDQAITVPPVAVRQGPSGPYVYVLHPDDTVSAQPVTLGDTSETIAVIKQGLAAGTKIITQGGSRLKDGAKVKPVPSA
ncbi:MAG: efflux transporter periplasmic adaptor subunit [Rhodospirillales bacterium 20-60-12]|nr:MAG: efflux transporter periplasmic adaptor subunit [Rhodospirillales bacterium 20-60-12]HQT67228.1 efflux RND transporter periplasmic adaptor subunit [Acetobacteraceae bacterium]